MSTNVIFFLSHNTFESISNLFYVWRLCPACTSVIIEKRGSKKSILHLCNMRFNGTVLLHSRTVGYVINLFVVHI